MKQQKVIGVTGVAGTGKDTFFQLLSEKLPCDRFSLADELKREVNQWSKMHYHIDSVSCTREEKEIIRPFLVFHGTTKRHSSEGRYWIERLSDTLVKSDNSKFKVVTDIRYDEYENDEVSWLKDELGGVLVHISQFRYVPDPNEGALTRVFRQPINTEEARNDPKIKEKSDFQIEWEFLENGQINELSSYVDNFINWLHQRDEERTVRYDLNKENKSEGV